MIFPVLQTRSMVDISIYKWGQRCIKGMRILIQLTYSINKFN